MATSSQKQILDQLFNVCIRNRNFDGIDQYIAPDYVNHGIPGATGPAGMQQAVQLFLDGFPDMDIRIDQMIEEGSCVATRGRWTGTHTGSFMGLPASGKTIDIGYIDFWQFRDGKAVENRVQMDIAGLMQQIGAGAPEPVA